MGLPELMRDKSVVGKQACELLNASSLVELDALLAAAAAELDAGAHFFELAGFGDAMSPTRWAVTSLPVTLMDYYHAHRSHRIDPIRLLAYGSTEPFAWSALCWKRAHELYAQMQRHGIQTGITCADRGSRGNLGIMAFCGLPQRLGPNAQRELLRYVTLIGSAAQRSCSRLLAQDIEDSATNRLSFNEWRTLSLLAKPMTVKQVSKCLGVSPRTVEYYLDQISGKFNVSSRREALLLAVRDGLPPVHVEATQLRFSPRRSLGNQLKPGKKDLH